MTGRLVLACVLFGLATGCDGDADAPAPDLGPPLPASLTVAVLGAQPDGQPVFPPLSLALAKVDRAGGILGRVPLELRVIDTAGMSDAEVAEHARAQLADAAVVGLIGPDTTSQLMAVAPLAIDAGKVVVSYRSAGPDALRAFEGTRFLWRTRPSDLVRVGAAVRHARLTGIERLGLLTSVAPDADTTFFDWFGFIGTIAGYASTDLVIEGYGDRVGCADAAEGMLAARVDRVIVTAPDTETMQCIMAVFSAARQPDGALPMQVVYADDGSGMAVLADGLGADGIGLLGATAIFDDRFPLDPTWDGYREAIDRGLPRSEDGSPLVPITAAAAHDAVLIMALGLEVSGAQGGPALADGIAEVLAGRGETVALGPETVIDAFERVRRGERPDLVGPSGTLDFDPESGIDFAGGTLAEWVIEAGPVEGPPAALRVLRTLHIGPSEGQSSTLLERPDADSFVEPPPPDPEQVFVPASPERRRLAALIVSTSSGFSNYRHQADALARYARLREAGLSHDDIVMVGADDLVGHPENALPGVVRNRPGGPDVYRDVTYDLGVDADLATRIGDILVGAGPQAGPFLGLDADTDLYIYLVGHGGLRGLGIGASTVEDGLDGESVYTPDMLRAALCTLRAEGRVRRVFVEVEACHAGVFGDGAFEGIEAGCEDGPLTGVLLLSATNTTENSLGAGYDTELGAWVADQFSLAVLDAIDAEPDRSMLEVYRSVYLAVSGSHAALFNAATFGDLPATIAADFVPPAR